MKEGAWTKAGLHLGHVHFLIDRAQDDQRTFLMHQATHCVVICLLAALPRNGKGARQTKIILKKVSNAARIGIIGHNRQRGGGEKILRDRAPQIPNGFDGGVLFLLDKRFRIQVQKLTQAAQELRGGINSDTALADTACPALHKARAQIPGTCRYSHRHSPDHAFQRHGPQAASPC